ncbi:MAG: SpvB/TcaC N-terminal domain-containing protein [Blastocatellia bacterium]|nr:SpvB/TcaC N-terminal domain-containing protein [Blastocatellia bacterium]
MSEVTTPSSIISLPKGGGALQGMGETFSPDLFTGTGNFTVPISLPNGRNGVQPSLALVYSSGNGNSPFGLGWQLSIPGVARKTSSGIPRYRDADDTFVLSGAEDLVPVAGDFPGVIRYRPRTEGLFARIEYHRDARNSHWVVHSKDGLVSTYGIPDRFNDQINTRADIADPANSSHVFAWMLTETRDPFGNRIRYAYEADPDNVNGEWAQIYLRRIQYVEIDQPAIGAEPFLVSVDFIYADRPDPFSSHLSGFQIRTTRRCERIEVRTHAGEPRLVRSYRFVYLDQRLAVDDASKNEPVDVGGIPVIPVDRSALPLNGASLLSQIHVIGHDESQPLPDQRSQRLPPLEFGYSHFAPGRRDFFPLQGQGLPAATLSSPELELVDLFGNGLPDFIEMNGAVRYWRNLGGGRFDLPRLMTEAPAGVSLRDPGVQLIDANGDGRMDLLVSAPGFSGYYPLRFDGHWDRRSFQRYRTAPSVALEGADVQLVDLTGDGVTDAIRSADRLECYFNDPREGWGETRWVERRALPDFPNVNFSDSRVRWADMSGDGLQDIVLVHDGNIEYWANLGYGNWGRRVHMRNSPRFPANYDPRQILIADVDGDGLADLVFVDHCEITLWINQSGNAWSEPIRIDGTPAFTNQDDVRLVDLLGAGVAGILWSLSDLGNRRERFFFLDFTRGAKPYVLNEMNNHRGAITQVAYRSSTEEYLRDQARPETRWRTPLPFPVQVVSKVVAIDEFSRGRLTTEYRYHHGYWDGGEREYRGFGYVEALSTETFDIYQALAASTDPFARVDEAHYSPPTLTKSWFHLGPVGDEFGEWTAVDHGHEYWQQDAPFFSAERGRLQEFLNELEQRRDRRDALRALRGTSLRTEVYALDDTPRENRLYTVTESFFDVREIDSPAAETDNQRIFFPHLLAHRVTQWERGDDPMTQIRYTGDYDDHGQPRRQLQIACPRGWRDFEVDARPGTDYLTTLEVMSYAQRDDEKYIVDRRASSNTFQIYPPSDQAAPALTIAQLQEQAFNGEAPRALIAQGFNYYDGEAFIGLPLGDLGEFGAVIRTETLVTTEDLLAEAYRGEEPDAPAAIPVFFDPDGAIDWTEEYPQAFRQGLPALAGYRFDPGDVHHARGYFIDSSRNRYDFQTPGFDAPRGTPLASRDPMGRETAIVYDQFSLLPERVTDSAGMSVTARNDYRVLKSDLITEPNGNRSAVTFTPLGLPASIAMMGRAEEAPIGDTLEAPGTRFEYDLLAYDNSPADNRQPVFIRTIRRVHHVTDLHIPVETREETIESIEYSDGFGRLLQTRIQAEDVLFGAGVFGNETLSADQTDAAGTAASVIGRRRATEDPSNVVVSGWRIYDNKGQIVEKYEPFFDAGWDYLSLEEAAQQREAGLRNLFGQRAQQFYDPRGQLIRTVNPDGSEQLVIYGAAIDLADPDNFIPTPWEAYTYDANDLAPLSEGRDADDNPIPLKDRAPENHHFTPSSFEIDALGRKIRNVKRNGGGPQNEIETISTYDIRGNLLTVRDALGRTAFSYGYDFANRTTRVQSIDAGIKRTVYDAAGSTIEQRDSRGALILTAFDQLNRPVDVWARDDAMQIVTLRQHLVYGDNPAEIGVDETAARQNNLWGRLAAHYDEAGLVLALSYDFKGNLLEKARQAISDQEILSVFSGAANNNWRISAYQIDWQPEGSSINARAAAILETTVYRTTNRYDALNRVTEIEYPRDVENERKILRPGYNRAGALESVSFDGDVYVERVAYNARGQRTLIAYGNGVMTRYAYDPRTFRMSRLRSERFSRPDETSYQPVGAALQDFAYEYDLAGNITAIRDRVLESGIPNTLPGVDALDREFTYDPIYRLLSATGRECDIRPDAPPWADAPRCTDLTRTRAYTERYEYDLLDNMLSLRHQNNTGGFSRNFTLNADNNRLATMTIGQSDFDYAYDASGNLSRETTSRNFEWDCASRLKAFRTQTEAAEPSVFAQYFYDASGMRVKKVTRLQGGQFEATTYLDNHFEHHRRSEQENNSLHVMDGEERVALVRAGVPFPDDFQPATQFLLADHLSSCGTVLGSAGELIHREEFTPYGETSFGSFARKRYRFTGKERDEESGWNYHGARYFVSWIGRWSGPDPLGPVDGLSLYIYVNANPIVKIDPQGKEGKKAVIHTPNTLIVTVEAPGHKRRNDGDFTVSPGQEDPDSFVSQITMDFSTRRGFEVANFLGSDSEKVEEQVKNKISDFRDSNPNGFVVAVGHSKGAANLIHVSEDTAIDLLITIDPENESDFFDYEVNENVENLINYYTNPDYGFIGGEEVSTTGHTNAVNIFVPNSTHTLIDNQLRFVVSEDIEFAIFEAPRIVADLFLNDTGKNLWKDLGNTTLAGLLLNRIAKAIWRTEKEIKQAVASGSKTDEQLGKTTIKEFNKKNARK